MVEPRGDTRSIDESANFTRLRSLALPLGRAERMELLRREITLLEIGEGFRLLHELVSHDTARYASAPRRFVVLDLTRDPLPVADLILCRDLLIHPPLADATRLLVNVRAPGARWFLGTHYRGARENLEIISGGLPAFEPLPGTLFVPRAGRGHSGGKRPGRRSIP